MAKSTRTILLATTALLVCGGSGNQLLVNVNAAQQSSSRTNNNEKLKRLRRGNHQSHVGGNINRRRLQEDEQQNTPQLKKRTLFLDNLLHTISDTITDNNEVVSEEERTSITFEPSYYPTFGLDVVDVETDIVDIDTTPWGAKAPKVPTLAPTDETASEGGGGGMMSIPPIDQSVYQWTGENFEWEPDDPPKSVFEEINDLIEESLAPTTKKPTISPSSSPTTDSPTVQPSKSPTVGPSKSPTVGPSKSPSIEPSVSPTTSSPSKSPSEAPTTSEPSKSPTVGPSKSPSIEPSVSPTTSSPSKSPSEAPTTSEPSQSPTVGPSESPSIGPSVSPTTPSPSKSPSEAPTTASPSKSPSVSPTTSNPSSSPSVEPTSKSPSLSPTTNEPTTLEPTTLDPSKSPTLPPILESFDWANEDLASMSMNLGEEEEEVGGVVSPTTQSPTLEPSSALTTSEPSKSPTVEPSKSPTVGPSKSPSIGPSVSPTTSSPSKSPSEAPTTASPSKSPSVSPTTSDPSSSPSAEPTTKSPSSSPTTNEPVTNEDLEKEEEEVIDKIADSLSPTTSSTTYEPTIHMEDFPVDDEEDRGSRTYIPTKSPVNLVGSDTLQPTAVEASSSVVSTTKSPVVTTTKPTMSPSKSPSETPTTASPSSTPSIEPTTVEPSKSPSLPPVQASFGWDHDESSTMSMNIDASPTLKPTIKPSAAAKGSSSKPTLIQAVVTPPPTKKTKSPTIHKSKSSKTAKPTTDLLVAPDSDSLVADTDSVSPTIAPTSSFFSTQIFVSFSDVSEPMNEEQTAAFESVTKTFLNEELSVSMEIDEVTVLTQKVVDFDPVVERRIEESGEEDAIIGNHTNDERSSLFVKMEVEGSVTNWTALESSSLAAEGISTVINQAIESNYDEYTSELAVAQSYLESVPVEAVPAPSSNTSRLAMIVTVCAVALVVLVGSMFYMERRTGVRQRMMADGDESSSQYDLNDVTKAYGSDFGGDVGSTKESVPKNILQNVEDDDEELNMKDVRNPNTSQNACPTPGVGTPCTSVKEARMTSILDNAHTQSAEDEKQEKEISALDMSPTKLKAAIKKRVGNIFVFTDGSERKEQESNNNDDDDLEIKHSVSSLSNPSLIEEPISPSPRGGYLAGDQFNYANVDKMIGDQYDTRAIMTPFTPKGNGNGTPSRRTGYSFSSPVSTTRTRSSRKDKLFDVYAPPGPLGIIIDTTPEGPMIHSLKPTSQLSGLVNPGDLIVGLDGVDTRNMTAATFTRLMAKRSQGERKITLLKGLAPLTPTTPTAATPRSTPFTPKDVDKM